MAPHWGIGLLAAAFVAAVAHAQPVEPVRLEWRLLPQTGSPDTCITSDMPGPVFVRGAPKRFELQLRLLDTDPDDGITPTGIATLRAEIRLDVPAAGTIARAIVLRSEQIPNPPPDSDVNCSGRGTGLRTGLVAPFRGGVRTNDNAPANGVPVVDGIVDILPLTLSPTNQFVPSPGPHDGWFPLYIFEFHPASDFVGAAVITARAVPGATGETFAWYESGQPVLRTSNQAVSVSMTVTSPPPAPVACCNRMTCTVLNSIGECIGTHGRGRENVACTPELCCRGDFNLDGVIQVQDLFDFLAAYLAGIPSADLDGPEANNLSIIDVYYFLGVYFTRCP